MSLVFSQVCAAPVATASMLAPLLARNAALPPAPRIATEAFSRSARLHAVHISPDGAWVAYLEGGEAGVQLHVLNTRTQTSRRLLASLGKVALFWSGDSHTLFLAAPDGVSAVSLADGASRKLLAFDGQLAHQVLHSDASHARHVLIDTYHAANGNYRVERVDALGQREVLYQGAKLAGFLLDAAGQLRFSRSIGRDGKPVIARREGSVWKEILRCQPLDDCTLVAVSADGSRLSMLMTHNRDRNALIALDLVRGTRRVVHADRRGMADIRRVVHAGHDQAPLFALFESPMLHHAGLTVAARQAVADIERRFAHSGVLIEAASNGVTLLLTETGPRLSQERYWLYDSVQRRFHAILLAQRAAGKPLPEVHLAQTSAIDYLASDGRLLHGYLTLPPGKAAGSIPLVTIVHGGPWGRVNAGYSSRVQLLANRGVAVFQPNYRASAGYGLQYLTAAGSDFGNGRVQANIVDGVRWLLKQGVGDRQRLAIIGHSFGGYASLLALTHTPDLFQFGMAMSPPPDFERSLRQFAAGGAGDEGLPQRLQALGVAVNDVTAMAALKAAAPVRHTDKVSKPLLILSGARDRLVDIASVTDYVARLQLAGKPVSLLVDQDEEHNPRKVLYNQATLYLLEELLYQYLGAPPPAAPEAELAVYLRQTLKANAALPAMLLL